MIKEIFINLAVKNLDASKEFWTKLGFSINPQFTNQNAACVVLGANHYIMFLAPSFFSTFTKKELADSFAVTEVITAFCLENRQAVDELMQKALAAGATEYRDLSDYGWMYGRAFQDLDGHLWEPFAGDDTQAPSQPT